MEINIPTYETDFAELKQQNSEMIQKLNWIEKELVRLKPKEEPDFIDIAEVKKILKVSRPTIYKYADEGIFNLYKTKGKTMFKKSEIINSLQPVFEEVSNYQRQFEKSQLEDRPLKKSEVLKVFWPVVFPEEYQHEIPFTKESDCEDED